MTSDFEIGRVVGVNTAQISVELNQTIGGMNKRTFEGIQEVGLIGSYVIVPRDSLRLVGIVTRVAYEEKNSKSEGDIVVLSPTAKQTLHAVLIGTIEKSNFTQGVSIFPLLDAPVHLSTEADLDLIFMSSANIYEKKSKKPNFSIPIGKSVVFPDRSVAIDPDAFFGKHAAILGSTGSGKSCTVASIFQSIVEQKNINRTTFVILDTNGEYRRAFQMKNDDGTWSDIADVSSLYIPTDPNQRSDRLTIPYWFMNTEDFLRLFKASPKVQSPVLYEAIRLARNNITIIEHNSTITYANECKISADSPSYFNMKDLRKEYLEKLTKDKDSWGSRVRSDSSTMLLRIDRLLADLRFDFLFGNSSNNNYKPLNSLATFIRDILGIESAVNFSTLLSNEDNIKMGQFPFYDRQRQGNQSANVVILDLSLLASEILEYVTALLGRLILEFLQRLGEYDGGKFRAKFPVVLVLEEAQNYVYQRRFSESDSIAKLVYERIAREGRKYGLGLVVASQRPSELSKTVLSQCNSFIVHRLQNPNDLKYFKEIVPSIYESMLDQLPALPPQTALVLGECVPAPMLVKIREANPIPLCSDPEFYAYWTSDTPPDIPFEEICAIWEGKKLTSTSEEPMNES